LKGEIDTEASDYTIGKVKVEIRLVKRGIGRWGTLVGDTPDGMHIFVDAEQLVTLTPTQYLHHLHQAQVHRPLLLSRVHDPNQRRTGIRLQQTFFHRRKTDHSLTIRMPEVMQL
jgi:hypothetical protein